MKVLLIGNGFIGDAHRNAYKTLIEQGVDVEVAAICDIREEMLQKNEFGAKTYTDIDEMLKNEKDATYADICVPTYLHKEFSIKCMKAGLHVLCEKPMALHEEDAKEMMACSKETGKTLMIAHSARFGADILAIRKFIMEGKFGKPTSAFFVAADGNPDWGYQDWFKDKERSGGCMLDLQAHTIDHINWLFGLPDYVSTVGMEREDYTGFGSLSSNLVYKDGLFVHVWCDWFVRQNKYNSRSTRVNFENGYIYNMRGSNRVLVAVDKDGNETDLTGTVELNNYSQAGEIEYFITSITEGTQPRMCMPEESAKVIKIMRAQEKSAENNGMTIYL